MGYPFRNSRIAFEQPGLDVRLGAARSEWPPEPERGRSLVMQLVPPNVEPDHPSLAPCHHGSLLKRQARAEENCAAGTVYLRCKAECVAVPGTVKGSCHHHRLLLVYQTYKMLLPLLSQRSFRASHSQSQPQSEPRPPRVAKNT